MKHDLRVASLSDVHLGHPRTTTTRILRELDETFPDSPELQDLDFIFVVGDLFDRSLSLHDRSVREIERWMHRFLRRCKKRDVAVRILEGTPSHDRRQSQMFAVANEEGGYDIDLRYVDTLSIEYHEKHDIHLLYVPDEWAHETDDVWRQVTALLDAHQIQKVDFTLLHGAMDYQLPDVAKGPRHSTERYLSITQRAVFVGHVHISSRREHLFAHGSFSRLSHNEEEAKGHWRCQFKVNGELQAQFIENRNAQLYKTLRIYDESIEDALHVMDVVKDFPKDSHVRIEADRSHSILQSLDTLRKTHPHVHWTTKVRDSNTVEVQKNLLVDMRSQYTPLHLTSNNLCDILIERLKAAGHSEALRDRAKAHLGALL